MFHVEHGQRPLGSCKIHRGSAITPNTTFRATIRPPSGRSETATGNEKSISALRGPARRNEPHGSSTAGQMVLGVWRDWGRICAHRSGASDVSFHGTVFSDVVIAGGGRSRRYAGCVGDTCPQGRGTRGWEARPTCPVGAGKAPTSDEWYPTRSAVGQDPQLELRSRHATGA